MRIIRSLRLTMRPWEPDDAAFLLDLESRWQTVRYLTPDPTTMATLGEAAASIVRRRAVDHPVHGIWAITLTETGQLLGNLLLKPIAVSSGIARPAPVEVGWHLHPDAYGHGYATEAADAVLRDAGERGLQFVVAVTDPRNVASQRVCRRLGFTECGVTHDFYDADYLVFEKSLG
ncbi:Protein N-acetyltransferase, RimJ/RimL family [Agreia bicolorata]|uniref:Protein N-acetyltransferase, RimJ/RimL family n=1 Tax=Agreia bicolorata TaxID=110935 RepID=A0A1T4YLR3_9MICO|nr:GNAT family N-acetyltransferase [Agreia bicolorata]SKB02640.1 Protein N-acetyltransferase, RimJ/RimL family [Agreia bicolorata]